MNTADISIFEVLAALRARAGWIVLAMLSCGLLGLLGSFAIPRVYRSESKLMVRLGRENSALDPTMSMGEQHVLTAPPSREEEINSVVEILDSRYIAERVAAELGPAYILDRRDAAPDAAPTPISADAGPSMTERITEVVGTVVDRVKYLRDMGPMPDSERATVRLMKNLRVEAVRDSSIVKLGFDSSDPATAQRILSAVVGAFLQHHGKLHRTPGGAEFLTEQATAARKELGDVEQQLADLKSKEKVVSTDDERRVHVDRLAKLSADLMATRADRFAAQALIAGIRGKIEQSPETEMVTETTGRDPESVSGMRQKLYELEMQEKNLSSRYAEDHILLKQVREQLRHAEEILADEPANRVEVTRGLSSQVKEGQRMLLEAEPRYDALLAKEKVQAEQVDAAQVEITQYIAAERQIGELVREKELNDARYRRFATEVYRSQIDQGLENNRMSNISIAEPATLEVRPRSPNPLLNMGLGIFLGGLMSVTWTMWREMSSNRIRSDAELEMIIDAPVLARLPKLNKRQLHTVGRRNL